MQLWLEKSADFNGDDIRMTTKKIHYNGNQLYKDSGNSGCSECAYMNDKN